MGTRQARRLRRVESAHDMYVGVLLAVGLPQRLKPITRENCYGKLYAGDAKFAWDDAMWRANVTQLYLESFGKTFTPPGPKSQKRFVRGFTAWCRKEVEKRSDYEDHTVHGVTGRKRK